MMLNRPNLIEDSDGIGYGDGYRDGDGDGDGYDGGNGNGNGNGYEHGNRYGDGQLRYRINDLAENSYCTRLLTNRYPDINFYICQLHLMRKTK